MKKIFTIALLLILATFATMASAEEGKSFNESAVTLGGYRGINVDFRGMYLLPEFMHWKEQVNAGRNLGIGALLLGDYGGNKAVEWNSVAAMLQVGLYEIVDKKESVHILAKPRVGIKYHTDGSAGSNPNLMWGFYGELDKVVNPLNRIGITVDTMYEERRDEGYLNPRIFYEKGFVSGKKLLIGAGPNWHYSGNSKLLAFSPVVSLKTPTDRDNAITVGVIGDIFSEKNKSQNSIGVFITWAWNDIHIRHSKK